MEESLLNIEKMTVAYHSTDVLTSIDMYVNNGEFVSIVGKSGSGKTTLLNCIANFIPFQGSINRPKNISYVFQDKSLFPWMTVKQNILFGLEHLDKSRSAKVVSDVLQKVELSGYENRFPYQLSGGQVQRVSIARSLSYDNSLILCDEPFSALDTITKSSIINWFLSLIDGSKTFLFVTHSVDDAILLSDRVIVIADKKIAGDIVINIERTKRKDVKNAEAILYKKNQIESLINS